jgi:hypothetical protein
MSLLRAFFLDLILAASSPGRQALHQRRAIAVSARTEARRGGSELAEWQVIAP